MRGLKFVGTDVRNGEMKMMDDDLTATMPGGRTPGPKAPDDCVTLFSEERKHAWISLGEARVCDGLWSLLRRRQDEPACRADTQDAAPRGIAI